MQADRTRALNCRLLPLADLHLAQQHNQSSSHLEHNEIEAVRGRIAQQRNAEAMVQAAHATLGKHGA